MGHLTAVGSPRSRGGAFGAFGAVLAGTLALPSAGGSRPGFDIGAFGAVLAGTLALPSVGVGRLGFAQTKNGQVPEDLAVGMSSEESAISGF